MNRQILFSLVVLLIFPLKSIIAQVEFSNTFKALLEQAQLSYFAPLENSYQDARVIQNTIQNYSFAIRSKKEKMEIRYTIDAFHLDQKSNDIPHLKSLNIASNVASNEEGSNIAVHSIDHETLLKYYNADWGASFIFKPKIHFADKQYCKMIALYAEGKGMVYIFYLFDQPTKELENQAYCFRFND